MISLLIMIYLTYGLLVSANLYSKEQPIISFIVTTPFYAVLWLPLWLWVKPKVN